MRKAQAILEFTVIIACFIAALLVMQIYFKRGLAGKWRSAVDDLGQQYSPRHTTSDITMSQNSTVTTRVSMEATGDGRLTAVTRTTFGPSEERRFGSETTGAINAESLFE